MCCQQTTAAADMCQVMSRSTIAKLLHALCTVCLVHVLLSSSPPHSCVHSQGSADVLSAQALSVIANCNMHSSGLGPAACAQQHQGCKRPVSAMCSSQCAWRALAQQLRPMCLQTRMPQCCAKSTVQTCQRLHTFTAYRPTQPVCRSQLCANSPLPAAE